MNIIYIPKLLALRVATFFCLQPFHGAVSFNVVIDYTQNNTTHTENKRFQSKILTVTTIPKNTPTRAQLSTYYSSSQ